MLRVIQHRASLHEAMVTHGFVAHERHVMHIVERHVVLMKVLGHVAAGALLGLAWEAVQWIQGNHTSISATSTGLMGVLGVCLALLAFAFRREARWVARIESSTGIALSQKDPQGLLDFCWPRAHHIPVPRYPGQWLSLVLWWRFHGPKLPLATVMGFSGN